MEGFRGAQAPGQVWTGDTAGSGADPWQEGGETQLGIQHEPGHWAQDPFSPSSKGTAPKSCPQCSLVQPDIGFCRFLQVEQEFAIIGKRRGREKGGEGRGCPKGS